MKSWPLSKLLLSVATFKRRLKWHFLGRRPLANIILLCPAGECLRPRFEICLTLSALSPCRRACVLLDANFFIIFLFLLLMIHWRPIIWEITGPIVTKFSEWIQVWVGDLTFYFRSLKGHCNGNRFLGESFGALAFHNGWEDRIMDACVSIAEDPSTADKNFVKVK